MLTLTYHFCRILAEKIDSDVAEEPGNHASHKRVVLHCNAPKIIKQLKVHCLKKFANFRIINLIRESR